jgi:hypothetical protein
MGDRSGAETHSSSGAQANGRHVPLQRPLSGAWANGQTARMDAETEHFLIMVGGVCDDARLAHMPVLVTTTGGRLLQGVPEAHPASLESGEPELAETGYTNDLDVDGEVIALDEVQEILFVRPAP